MAKGESVPMRQAQQLCSWHVIAKNWLNIDWAGASTKDRKTRGQKILRTSQNLQRKRETLHRIFVHAICNCLPEITVQVFSDPEHPNQDWLLLSTKVGALIESRFFIGSWTLCKDCAIEWPNLPNHHLKCPWNIMCHVILCDSMWFNGWLVVFNSNLFFWGWTFSNISPINMIQLAKQTTRSWKMLQLHLYGWSAQIGSLRWSFICWCIIFETTPAVLS